ncbi:Zinc ABC transporter, ATP-binding protein ZnuC [Microbacterium esteraromaticum]|uniref:Zinc ABC transporter, ATP-binding protein ZnuC n=1 Tax=Microbacterium esteraromaticum TaxID=57043 RepID=A0A1R4IBW0_9MICO|nr:metal ABC transporter ATP-binding protein [Microbacterium esteraromaticum]SJN17298.1 Zinc ABC transporter, ATP-binding protein ZnuC [Microbacterium esteraromaticum]
MSGAEAHPQPASVLTIAGAALHRGSRELWAGLDLDVAPGEFIAVLGPSGSGKTTLLRSILGLQPLSAGSIRVGGDPVRRGNPRIGYVPQQRPLPPDTSMRARDLVALGVRGARFGLPIPHRGDRARVDALLDGVGAAHYADRRVGLLSGGEQQRLRVGQALADQPMLLLCDEPLSNLDLANQRGVTDIIDRQRHDHGTAVLFVTHDINPILGHVDRILYIAGGRFVLGTPDEVLQSRVLTELYGTPVFVLRAGDRLVVVGVPDAEAQHEHEHDHDDAAGAGGFA